MVPVLKLSDSGPNVLSGSSELPEDLEELVNFGISGEEGSLRDHLDENCANGPNIDGRGICLGAEENLRRPVPEGNNLVGEGSDGRAEGTCKAKVGQLEAPITGHQQVLGLQVTVHHSTGMAESEPAKALEEVALHQQRAQHSIHVLHVFFQVPIQKLENQVQLAIRLDTILKLNNIVVAKLPQKGNLPQGSGRNSLILNFQANALQSYNLIGCFITGLVHNTIGTLTQVGLSRLFDFLIPGMGLRGGKIEEGK